MGNETMGTEVARRLARGRVELALLEMRAKRLAPNTSEHGDSTLERQWLHAGGRLSTLRRIGNGFAPAESEAAFHTLCETLKGLPTGTVSLAADPDDDGLETTADREEDGATDPEVREVLRRLGLSEEYASTSNVDEAREATATVKAKRAAK